MIDGILNWLEQRTGLVKLTTDFLTEDVPGGASYWYAFGSATMFAMILQIVTGIFLTFYYAPSKASAWESTSYIYHHVPFGQFVISLHFWGATAMIALLAMHMLQVLLWGSYKAPRELMWVVGVLLLVITMVLGLTGYLLPWDMNAYFASRVAINIASSIPFVGIPQQQFLDGGPDMGTLTINRFFGLHVWLMPAALVALVGLHLTIFRHNGSAGPPTDHDLKKLPQGRFWPNQMFMDAVLSFAVFAIMVALAIFSPAPFDVKADPKQNFIAYPAWYFLALYGLLRIAGGVPPQFAMAANLLATVAIPGALVTLLILLPFIDRNPSRRLSRRPWIVGITAISLVAAIGLSIFSQLAIQKEQVDAGINPNGPGVANADDLYKVAAVSPQVAAGEKVFSTNCASCHGAAGGGGVGPALAGNKDLTGDPKPILHTLLFGLSGKTIGGKTFAAPMPAWKGTLTNADIAAVASYVRASWGNTAPAVSERDVAAVKK